MSIIPIRGVVQHYAWGGYRFIPELLKLKSPATEPHAEYWMGVHHRGPAVSSQDGRPLRDLLSIQPRARMGAPVVEKFGGDLPFLFKVLDVRKMLSIQTHPTKQAAEIGYQLENRKGIPLNAFHRNYKDDNHKPEIMVALTDFWLLHGFRSESAITDTLQRVPEFEALIGRFRSLGLREFYRYLMELPQQQVNEILGPLEERLRSRNDLKRSQPDYWAAEAFRDYTQDGNYDRGIFSIYLFNLVRVDPGQGIFQDAGIPHAYLEGVNVELMANSDNVFRGGLTPKHVDVAELMEHVRFEAVTPRILKGQALNAYETHYPSPAPDFALTRIRLSTDEVYAADAQTSGAILICMNGKAKLRSGEDTLNLSRGEVCWIDAGTDVEYQASGTETTEFYKAFVPA